MIYGNFLTYLGPSNLEGPVHSVHSIQIVKHYRKFGLFYWVHNFWNKERMLMRFYKKVMHSRRGSWRVMVWPERVLKGPGGSIQIQDSLWCLQHFWRERDISNWLKIKDVVRVSQRVHLHDLMFSGGSWRVLEGSESLVICDSLLAYNIFVGGSQRTIGRLVQFGRLFR